MNLLALFLDDFAFFSLRQVLNAFSMQYEVKPWGLYTSCAAGQKSNLF